MAVFNVIEHAELSSAVTVWTSGTFATSYDHLFITMSARLDSGYNSGGYWRFNSDAGNNYSMTDLQSYNASSVGTYYSTAGNAIGFTPFSGASSTANTFGSLTMWIPNYANTSYYKTVLITSGAESMTTTSSQYAVKRTAGLWQSTSAITSFNVHINGGHDFVQYSSYTVYGVTNDA